MQPEPLLRMFPDPSFDHGVDGRRRADKVDLSIAIARQVEGFGQLQTKTAAWEPYRATTMNRAIELAGQPGDNRA